MKIGKRYRLALGLSLTILMGSHVTWAYTPVIVNGKAIEMDVDMMVENGVNLVPISFIAKELGADVSWENPEVTIKKGNQIIKCRAFSKEAFVDGEAVELPVEAQLEWGRVCVPLRFVAESFGAKVTYDEVNNTIHITQDAEESMGQSNEDMESGVQEAYYYVFYDETSECYIYQTGESLVYDTKTNTWYKLAESLTIMELGDGAYPEVYQTGHLNLKDRQLLIRNNYIPSTDGRWRFMKCREWYDAYGRVDVGFIQEANTGEVKEILRSKSSLGINPLPDNTFLVEMSADGMEEPNVIYPDKLYIYDPNQAAMTYIATGQRGAYVERDEVIVYESNNTYYTYDLNTQTIQKISLEQYQIYYDLLYGMLPQADQKAAPKPPSLEECAKLPTITLERIEQPMGSLKIKGKTVAIDFVYQKSGVAYVPAKNVIQLTGMQVGKDAEGNRLASHGAERIILNKENSATYDERLYISQDVLGALGIQAEIIFHGYK
ncbi:MAG: copper amine oxidase N-terminal domain-containing protein [Cellulosilyticaceae bacterium]